MNQSNHSNPISPVAEPATVEALHAFYCQQLRESLLLRDNWRRLWWEYLRAGFDLEQLRLVLSYLLREVNAGRRNPGALKLTNLLQIDRFEEDRLLARMQQRQRHGSSKAPGLFQPQSVPEISDQQRSETLHLLRECRRRLAARCDPTSPVPPKPS
ncbi:unnamed protein product [uncultured bacterium]|nr:unnamed protein product [uncultured bacterium]